MKEADIRKDTEREGNKKNKEVTNKKRNNEKKKKMLLVLVVSTRFLPFNSHVFKPDHTGP